MSVASLTPPVIVILGCCISGIFSLQHPVLSLGEGLGSRVVLYKGHSDFSGSYVVEECESEGEGRVRRLVFLNNPRLAQTEVKIVSGIDIATR